MARPRSKVSDAWDKVDQSLSERMAKELINKFAPLALDEVTSVSLSKLTGRSKRDCQTFIEKEVKEGKLVFVRKGINGAHVFKEVKQ